MWEEKGSSDTRLLEAPLLPDDLTVIGESLGAGGRWHREHVVPRLVVIKKCHEMLEMQAGDDAIAKVVRDYVKIVRITHEESQRLDLQANLGLKQSMPPGWTFEGGDPYARLKAAGIQWRWINTTSRPAAQPGREASFDSMVDCEPGSSSLEMRRGGAPAPAIGPGTDLSNERP